MLRPSSASRIRGASQHQTNWSADTAGCSVNADCSATVALGSTDAPPIDTNCAGVGSAQQYQGSLKNGTGTEELCSVSAGATTPAAACAAPQILPNAAARESFCASQLAAIS